MGVYEARENFLEIFCVLKISGIFMKWKKEMEKKLEHGFSKEKIPAIIRRCPKCHNLSLEYDIEKGRIFCTRCGFEEHIPKVK